MRIFSGLILKHLGLESQSIGFPDIAEIICVRPLKIVVVTRFLIKEQLVGVVLGIVEGETQGQNDQRMIWVLQLRLDHFKELPS